jgi:hypothetical protein
MKTLYNKDTGQFIITADKKEIDSIIEEIAILPIDIKCPGVDNFLKSIAEIKEI